MNVDKFGRYQNRRLNPGPRGPPGVGFSVTFEGNFNIKNKRLCSVGGPVNSNDASTKHYVDSLIQKLNIGESFAKVKVKIDNLENWKEVVVKENKQISNQIVDLEKKILNLKARLDAKNI